MIVRTSYGNVTISTSRRLVQRLATASGYEVTPKYHGVCFRGADGIVVGVFDGSLGTLAHELLHAVLFIAEDTGLEPFASNGEPLAYLMGDLFTRTRHLIKE